MADPSSRGHLMPPQPPPRLPPNASEEDPSAWDAGLSADGEDPGGTGEGPSAGEEGPGSAPVGPPHIGNEDLFEEKNA